jgi:hypothetical protein
VYAERAKKIIQKYAFFIELQGATTTGHVGTMVPLTGGIGALTGR